MTSSNPSTQLGLEIVEGPGAGLRVPLREPVVIGRGEGADLVLDNVHVSRRHARVAAGAGGDAIVEDLGSSNGTFVNQTPVHGPTRMSVGDELLVGLTVLALRTTQDIDRRATAVHPISPLSAEPQPLPVVVPAVPRRSAEMVPAPASIPELERLLDVNVKFSARTAPLAVLVLVALVVCVYLGAR